MYGSWTVTLAVEQLDDTYIFIHIVLLNVLYSTYGY